MTEYDEVYDTADDAHDRLEKDHAALIKEYIILYNALMGTLDENKRRLVYRIDKNPKELNDLNMNEQSIKTARKRALKEGI